MKKILVWLLFIAAIASCKKEDTTPPPDPVEKTYTVEYRLTASARANTTLSGDITYVSKVSPTSIVTFSGGQWTVTESAWKLKAGDIVGFEVPLLNMGSYEARLFVNGIRVGYEALTNYVGPSPYRVFLQHKIE